MNQMNRTHIIFILFVFVSYSVFSSSTIKEKRKLIAVNVYAVDWNVLFCGGLLPYRIPFIDNVISFEIHNEKILLEVDKRLEEFEKKVKYIDKGLLDVRARFDLYYLDGSIKIICFSEPHYLSINGNICRDDDGELRIFGLLLPEKLGKRFFTLQKGTNILNSEKKNQSRGTRNGECK